MKLYRFIYWLCLFAAVACSNEDPYLASDTERYIIGEIECNTEAQDQIDSRTYFELDNLCNIYYSQWDKNDQIAICFNDSEKANIFKLLRGENSKNAVFYGPYPDNYNEATAVYPHTIYVGRNSDGIEVNMPSVVYYNSNRILSGSMPMYAHSSIGALNFYNLMAVIKISLQGSGLLKSISISSVDGLAMSGKAHIMTDENNVPILTMEDKGSNLTLNTGSILLSNNPTELFLPIPAITYQNGLKLNFIFEGDSKTYTLAGPLHFERSVLRAVKPYEVNVPFDIESHIPDDNEIWYTSEKQQAIFGNCDLGSSLSSHSFYKEYNLGVITTESAITQIGDRLFQTPKNVTSIKLPQTIREIGQSSLSSTAIEEFIAPESLRVLRTDAFLNCGNLKRVILNEGLQSMGLQVFGECPNIEYVYLPKTLSTIGAYSFRQSTEKLDHWDGDCPLIDEDRHSLYSNSVYGIWSEDPTMIDIVAGGNLTEYQIPSQAISTQNYALSCCTKLKKLIVHENFRYFGVDVFSHTIELETIVSYAETPPGFDSDEAFTANKLKEIRVPKESLEEYKNAYGWKNFADKIIPL